MPARTDHDRRDAQHAARARIAVELGRYSRRLIEAAYAHIEEEAIRDHDEPVDWSAFGTVAATRAIEDLRAPAVTEAAVAAIEPGPARGAD